MYNVKVYWRSVPFFCPTKKVAIINKYYFSNVDSNIDKIISMIIEFMFD